MKTRTTAEWFENLEAANIPVVPVNSAEDLLDEPQLEASGFWKLVEHPTEGTLRMTDPPARFSESASEIRLAPPRLGEHSIDILEQAGYSAEEIHSLIELGVTQIPSEQSLGNLSDT